MGKRKNFIKSDLATAQIEHVRDIAGRLAVPLEALPPSTTVVAFGRHAKKHRRFDFAPWYGIGIDEIAYASINQVLLAENAVLMAKLDDRRVVDLGSKAQSPMHA